MCCVNSHRVLDFMDQGFIVILQVVSAGFWSIVFFLEWRYRKVE